MKVLLINPHIFRGGAERIVVSTARWLNRLGVECDVLTLSLDAELIGKEEMTRFLLSSRKVEYTPNVAIHSSISKSLLELQSLCLSMDSVMDEYDVLNPHSFPAYWAFGLARARKKAGTVWTCHDVFDVYGPLRAVFQENRALRYLLEISAIFDRKVVTRNIDAIVTVSSLHARSVIRAYGKRPYIIPPAIEIESYAGGRGENFRDRYNLSDAFFCLHVGSLIPRKGQEISIRAIAFLRDLIPDVHLVLIGSGPNLQTLRKLVQDLGVEDNVIFTGKISDKDLKDAYNAANINLLPSTLESFGLTPMEALASGTISIVSKETGVSEYLRAYGIGYVLSSRDPAELAKAILHVYRNPEEANAKTKKAVDILEKNFSWPSYVRRLLEIYKTISRKRTSCC